MPDRELAELMHAETEHAPPARIDLAQAMRDGRRLRRRRTLRPVLAATAVLAVAGTIAVVRLAGPPAAGPPVASAPTVTATTPAAAPASFDPLRVRLSAAWVPAGLQRRDPVAATGTQQLTWAEPVGFPNNPARWVEVTIYAAGIAPWQVASGYWTMAPAEPINGGEAAWLVLKPRTPDPQCDVGCVDGNDKTRHDSEALAWRWAPNAWAVARVLETDASTQRAIARRVAEGVRTDGDAPVRLPFTVTRLPASLPLAMIEPYTPEPLYSAALRFGGGAEPMTQVSFHRQDPVTLTVTWVPAGYTSKDTPNRTLDGSPAAVHFGSAEWGSITLYRNGYEVSLSVPTRDGRRLVDEKLAIAIVTSVMPVTDPTDRTQWSTDPLR